MTSDIKAYKYISLRILTKMALNVSVQSDPIIVKKENEEHAPGYVEQPYAGNDYCIRYHDACDTELFDSVYRYPINVDADSVDLVILCEK